MIYVVVFAAGVGLGALLAWTLARGRAAALQARLDAALLAQDSQQSSFKALAADVLQANSKQFFEQTKQLMESLTKQAEATLEQRQQAVDHLVQPLQQTLGNLQREVSTMEGRRLEAFTNLERELGRLQQETGNLTTALRRPQARGRWGEITLRRVVEAAGMSKHCDFTEQSFLEGEEGRFRPDMMIHLPGERHIVVDSKTPLDAYLDAVEATNEADRNGALKRHAVQVRKQMEQLSAKDYWTRLTVSPEFVVLFLPGESFFSAALDQDRSLIEDGIEKRVIVATPTTLIALLKAVAFGWRQEQVAENSRVISELGKEMYDRVVVLTDHLRTMGVALARAVNSYNSAVGSFESRTLVTARKFKELGATVAEDIAPLDKVDETPRTLDVGQPALDPTWKDK